jgi:hypothetical protein
LLVGKPLQLVDHMQALALETAEQHGSFGKHLLRGWTHGANLAATPVVLQPPRSRRQGCATTLPVRTSQ